MEHVHSDSCKDCEGCGLCLFEAGFAQVSDDMYPLFRCLKCGKVNFWD